MHFFLLYNPSHLHFQEYTLAAFTIQNNIYRIQIFHFFYIFYSVVVTDMTNAIISMTNTAM